MTEQNNVIISSKNEIKSIVNAVLQSKEFKDSAIYSNLLSYLTQSTLSKKRFSEKIPASIQIKIRPFVITFSYYVISWKTIIKTKAGKINSDCSYQKGIMKFNSYLQTLNTPNYLITLLHY